MRFKKVVFFGLAFFFAGRLLALNTQPWFGDVYEFAGYLQYAYSHYNGLNHALAPVPYGKYEHLALLDLGLTTSPEWTFDGEVQFVDSGKQAFGFRSTAFQMRYLCLDDIVGDRCSLAAGLNARYTSHHSLTDVSCPYHAEFDFEANLAIGKELIGRLSEWRSRFWAYGVLGMANRGSPWLKGQAGLEINIREQQRLGLLFFAEHGFGQRSYIDPNRFCGYGKYRPRFIDVAVRYGLRLGVFGMLHLGYQRRLLAAVCPTGVNTYFIKYDFSFAF